MVSQGVDDLTVVAVDLPGNTFTLRMNVGPSSLTGTTRNFRSRLILGTRNPVIGGTALTEYMTISGGLKGTSTSQGTFGEISLHNEDNTVAGDAITGKTDRSMMYMCYIAPGGVTTVPKEPVIGFHNTSPAACVHIQNRKANMTPFRVDNDTSSNLFSISNNGLITLSSPSSTTDYSLPTANCLGYMKEVKNQTSVSMTAGVNTKVAEIIVPVGCQMLDDFWCGFCLSDWDVFLATRRYFNIEHFFRRSYLYDTIHFQQKRMYDQWSYALLLWC